MFDVVDIGSVIHYCIGRCRCPLFPVRPGLVGFFARLKGSRRIAAILPRPKAPLPKAPGGPQRHSGAALLKMRDAAFLKGDFGLLVCSLWRGLLEAPWGSGEAAAFQI